MIHLHTHTSWSFLDGYGLPEQYISRLRDIGQSAMAVTDHGNIFAHQSFWPEMEKAGMKFIPGVELYIKPKRVGEKYYHATVLAQNNDGYKNLCRLVSLSNQSDHIERRPMVSFSELRYLCDGLIILTGCFGDGLLHRAYHEDRESVLKEARFLKNFECPVYIEIQHINDEERDYFRNIAQMTGMECVPTIDAHYPRKEDHRYQDLAFCIGLHEKMSNPTRMRFPNQYWLMSDDEVLSLGFTSEEIAVTHKIADSVNVTRPKLSPIQIPGARDEMIRMIRENCKRLGNSIKSEAYRERYKYEMSVIDKLGLHSYFVIMGDVIREFKARGRFIGHGRGSSAGSLVCYLLGITEVDPLAHGLLFERFLDINRKDYPDIDTDFPQAIRGEVVEYLERKYGHDRIGHICSYGTYKSASTFQDLARIYGIGHTVATEIGKAAPNLINDAIGIEEILKIPAVEAITRRYPIFKEAIGLEDQIRQLGQHASGYAISPVPLTEITAQAATKDGFVISVNKDQAEGMGLLKLDILGLKTLDIIQSVCQKANINIESLYRMEFNDPEVFKKFNECETAGVFQFEGGAVRRALGQFKIGSLCDLSFINAVARPGASNALSGNIPVPEPLRKFIFRGKYFVYQEELMAICRFLNFSWEDVTKIRKMVSKKQVTKLEDQYKGKFISALSVHCHKREAEQFWNVMLKCGEYQFNLSHAVSYSILAYICMYLKVKYPDAFIEAYMDETEDDVKRRMLLREYVKRGYSYRVGTDSDKFIVKDKTIVGSVLSVKGIGLLKYRKMKATGKMDRGMEKAIVNASLDPATYCQWCALDDFGNRQVFSDAEDGEYKWIVRVWKVKDGKCYIEDAKSAVKAYFDPRFVKLKDGGVYTVYVDKYGYCKIAKAFEGK